MQFSEIPYLLLVLLRKTLHFHRLQFPCLSAKHLALGSALRCSRGSLSEQSCACKDGARVSILQPWHFCYYPHLLLYSLEPSASTSQALGPQKCPDTGSPSAIMCLYVDAFKTTQKAPKLKVALERVD